MVSIDSPKPNSGKGHHSREPVSYRERELQTAASMEEFAKANGQILLPLVERITQARLAIDEATPALAGRLSELF